MFGSHRKFELRTAVSSDVQLITTFSPASAHRVARIALAFTLGLVGLAFAGPLASAASAASLWSSATVPANVAATSDPNAVELGVKFRPAVDGTITGLRFYKAPTNTGTHVGNLWTLAGTRLATVTFADETGSGWQQANLSAPVSVTAGTTYVASYHAPNGNYAFDSNYFATTFANGPLSAPSSSEAGGNGVYGYGASAFPANSFNATNYWVDVVFNDTSSGPDTTPPTVTSVAPSDGATAVNAGVEPTATFSEPMNAATITTSTVQLSGPGGTAVPASVSYDVAGGRAVLTPTGGLADSTAYTMTVRGGASGVADTAGNRLAADRTWSFTTAATPPPPDSGPGGPILVITRSTNRFTQYYAEILRAEGLNEFAVRDISTVSAATLAGYDVAILGEMPLDATQAAMLSTWVSGGGNLIAMRPDADLATLLGLTGGASTLANSYLRVDTSRAPGAGIAGDTMQFHGTADRWSLNGATSVATLFSDASTATASPAVTLRSVGANGGQAAAFAFDLARSVVYSRQGNPAWAGQERDGITPIRSDDMFFGAGQPDWVDLSKVAIPQADEQQRLLANLIGMVAADRKPLPRFWYLPRDEKAAVVMTGDDHGNGGSATAARFDSFAAASPAGCNVAAWDCIRGTSYVFPGTITAAQANTYNAAGFEIGLHVTTGCSDYTESSLRTFFSNQLAQFRSLYPSLPAIVTNRTHCIPWSDWASHPVVELANGIRLDTNYYYFAPASWNVGSRPGFFTGSGFPMRFAQQDGAMIDVYQATTQMTDESGQAYPFTIDALLNAATGATGYYGVFTANMHTDGGNTNSAASAAAIVNSAKARGVPVVSAKQMLTWLDGRNNSSFGSIAWAGNALSFTVDAAAGSSGLRGMVPATGRGAALTTLTRNGSSVPTTRQTIKGVEYALFDATSGSYVATYGAPTGDTTAPVISSVAATATAAGVATVTWSTNEAASSRVDYGTAPATLSQNVTDATRVTAHSMQVTGLTPGTTYHFRVSSADAAGNSTTSPAPPAAPATVAVPAAAVSRAPNAVTIDAGSARSGTFADLAAADTAYYRTNSTTPLIVPLLGTPTSSWYGRFTSVPRALTSLKVTYAGLHSRSCTQVLQAYRWTTSSWVQIDSRAVSTTQVTISDLTPTGAAANYVSTGGEVRVRVRCTANLSFNTAGNLMRITYTT